MLCCRRLRPSDSSGKKHFFEINDFFGFFFFKFLFLGIFQIFKTLNHSLNWWQRYYGKIRFEAFTMNPKQKHSRHQFVTIPTYIRTIRPIVLLYEHRDTANTRVVYIKLDRPGVCTSSEMTLTIKFSHASSFVDDLFRNRLWVRVQKVISYQKPEKSSPKYNQSNGKQMM